MTDELNTPEVQVAPETTEAQGEQVVTADEVTDAPEAASDKEETLLAGKFKSVEDLEKSYEELQSEFTRTRQANKYEEQVPVVPQYQEPQTEFDEETAAGVKRLAQQEFVNLKVAEFQTKHGAELAKDKLLRAAVRTEMEEQSARGMIIDPELALETAKQELSKRMQPQVEQAKTEGLKEGQDIAKTKQQLGAVGETGKQPEADDSQLSPAEYAKKYNIPVSF